MDGTYLTGGIFLRVSSISVAAYDYLITIPAEWRMYRSKGSMRFGWSFSKLLFILIRYISIVLLVISDVGYFYHGFSVATCSRYYMVAPSLKVVQIMVSQVIIGYRTWAITRRSTGLGIFLLVLGIIVTALEWYSSVNFNGRTPIQVDDNCSVGNESSNVPQWVFYLVAMAFDAVTCILSSFFLIRSASGIGSVFSMSTLVKILFYDGLIYMVVLTAVNIMNLILYKHSIGKDQQSIGASFGYTIVWIMSQRILINIHDAVGGRADQRVFVNHQLSAPRDGSQAMRSQTGRHTKDGADTTTGGPDLQVQIKQTTPVDCDLGYGREKHPRLWDRKQGAVGGEGPSTEHIQLELVNARSVVNNVEEV